MRYSIGFFVLLLVLAIPASAADPPTTTVKFKAVPAMSSNLRVHSIDIGPGLAALVQTPNNRKTVFIDGGKWGLADMERYVGHFVPTSVADPADLNLAIVTHGDFDHYAGMNRIFDAYRVREFWYTGYTSDKLEGIGAWKSFRERLASEEAEDGCDVRDPVRNSHEVGERIVIDDGGTPTDTDDVALVLLNVDADPPARDPVFGREFSESERRNNASLVFKITYGSVSFLITGDINGRDKEHTGADTENEIDSEELELWVRHSLYPDRFGLGATVLQAAHHGSNGSNSLPFLKAVSPEWVVIPAGHEHDHPTVATLDRIRKAGVADAKVLRTDEGDSTPETSTKKDPQGDDCLLFETDGQEITSVRRVSIED